MSDDDQTLVLREVEVDGHLATVTVVDGRVASVDPVGPADPVGDAMVVDGDGGAVLPGLHDHHLHLLALAAALDSIAVGPSDVDGPDGFRRALADAILDRPADGTWLRAVGYHERVAGDLDRFALDAIVGDRRLRVQHRSGVQWTVSSAGLRDLGLLDGPAPDGVERRPDGTPTGRLLGLDGWLADRIGRTAPDVVRAGRHLLAAGVTGVTDATPFTERAALEPILAAARADAPMPKVVITGAPDLALGGELGRRDGDGRADASAGLALGVSVGPAKLLLADHRAPLFDEVVAAVETAHAAGRPLAVHCVTRVELVVTLAAFDEAGPRPGDRIEHAAVVPTELHADLRRLGLTVVTQPNFVAERGDEYITAVDPDDLPVLWPYASLLAAGIPVGLGTDAPFGDADPWHLLSAAAERRTPSGRVVGPDERVPPAVALGGLLSAPDRPGGPPRRVEAGAAADLCLLDRPLAAVLDDRPRHPVRGVVRGGRWLDVTDGR